MSTVKVGLVQMSCVADKEANLKKAIEKIREAAAKGAQIICLQELFTSLSSTVRGVFRSKTT